MARISKEAVRGRTIPIPNPINFLLLTLSRFAYCNQHVAFAFVPRRSSTTSTASSAKSLTLAHGEVFSTDQSCALLLERVDEIIDAHLFKGGMIIDRNNILDSVDREHVQDVSWAKASMLPFEGDNPACSRRDRWNPIEYEYILAEPGKAASITRTKRHNPLLTGDEIECLKEASESYWNRIEGDNETSEKSRFTYQRKGNREAHLSDVVQYNQRTGSKSYDVVSLVNDLLVNRVYPWIRSAYLSHETLGNALELFVYDSLFIRYNATAANADNDLTNRFRSGENSGRVGAGQPLHRDLGYVSVNIMLNEEFEGGGTFFENQLLPMVQAGNIDDRSLMQPLKPLGPGHGIAHYSNSRHAGAATYSGVREILVIFLAATEKKAQFIENVSISAPRWERNARLKAAARTHCSTSTEYGQIICRLFHHRLAIDQVIDDGEAWHYLGMALLDYHDHLHFSDDKTARDGRGDSSDVKLAVSCLNEATKHTPCDGRLYNNLGIALERLMLCYKSNSRVVVELRRKAVAAYQTSIAIHYKCEMMGCDVHAEILSASMNYGLYLSKLDQFGLAIDVLSRVVSDIYNPIDAENDMDEVTWARQRVVRDATKLLSFCKRQLDKESVL
ncbi:hypothetical protein ACHAXA_003613 [Cyclostephanos tholiformis]|uniref:Fe2OG dioxygenase domain-containing protein n=1 Tax=Cyclostephanos tholiformis TaxID=382380 RepID=A0ABD3SPN8_9STRA